MEPNVLLQYNATISQDRQVDTWAEKSFPNTTSQGGLGTDFSISLKRDSLFIDRETQLESKIPPPSRISLYGQDPGLSGVRSSGLGRPAAPIVTQVGNSI